jgi:uncharacterized cupredoxin-like copper-binding protein
MIGSLLAATVLLVAVGFAAASAAPGGKRSPLPARMLVYAQEWSLMPSRASVPAGKVTVQLWNRGEDAHDLRIRRLNSTGSMVGRAQGVALTQSGGLHQATWKLGAGRYEMYCSLPGHLMRGMHVRITVRRG